MSNSHGLSDEQVSNELKRMVAFIKQEAIEKSREIHIKVFKIPSFGTCADSEHPLTPHA